MSRPSLSADRAAFRRATGVLFDLCATPESGGEYAYCACGCKRMVKRGTPPHHLKDAAGGQGGRRKHAVEGLRILAQVCHDEFESMKRCECELGCGAPCNLESCEEGAG